MALKGVPPGGELWKIGKTFWVVYFVPGSKPPVPLAWKVESAADAQALAGPGNKATPVRTFSKMSDAAAEGLLDMGTRAEIVNMADDPFETFVEDYREQAQANPILQDEEVLALYTGALLEGRQPTPAELTQTGWWQTRSDAEREWATLLLQDPETARDRRADHHRAVAQMLREAGVSDVPDELVKVLGDRWVSGAWSESFITDQIRGVADPYAGVDLTQEVIDAARGFDPSGGDATALAGGATAVRDRVRQMYVNRGLDIANPDETEDEVLDRVTREVLAGRPLADVRQSLDRAAGTHPVTGSDITRAGEEDVRRLLLEWLGPALASEYEGPWVRRWASELRNNPDGETELLEELRALRLGAFPEWENENLRYADVAPTTKALFRQVWQQELDETDPFFLDVLRMTGPGGEGLHAASQRLRREGLTRGVGGVVQGVAEGINQATGGLVRESVI